jgi:rhamnulose-1-phosphate aldolase
MTQSPYPALEELLHSFGETGARLSELQATEGGAGNLSTLMRWPVDFSAHFPLEETIRLPLEVPGLAGACLLVSGSGCRLRQICTAPVNFLGGLRIDPGGQTARLYRSQDCQFTRLTSEFNSHLAVHADQASAGETGFHALIHAQPPYITYLSHIPRYRDSAYLSARLLRWQPEGILNLPEGIGVAPFRIPSSAELMAENITALHGRRIVVWAKHGVLARSHRSLYHALDGVEYAEAAARYEYLNLCAGEPADGLQPEEVRAIAASFGVAQVVY